MKKLFMLLFGSFITTKPKQMEVKSPFVNQDTNTIAEIRKRYREALAEHLKAENLVFIERDTRMDYGMVGRLFRNGQLAIMLYGNTFYVHDKDIAINMKTLKLIRAIQKEFAEVTRNENGRICVEEKGIGAVAPSTPSC